MGSNNSSQHKMTFLTKLIFFCCIAATEEISRYQDIKMKVQKYRPSTKELASGNLWHLPSGSGINKQVHIGNKGILPSNRTNNQNQGKHIPLTK